MRIVAIDDEELVLNDLLKTIEKVTASDTEIKGFQDQEQAFLYLSKYGADILFLDVEMTDLDGISFARKYMDICPTINIIFVTGYSQYAVKAFQIHASGYLTKPVRAQELKAEIDNLRYPLPSQKDNGVRIQTFGNFEIFFNERPVNFPRKKCRECLAYLVDRQGARVSVKELAGILWEDAVYDKRVENYTHRIITDMMKSLEREGISDIVIRTHRELAVDVEKIDCDYYAVLKGGEEQQKLFSGEYMSNYSWAEFTLGGLCRRTENR